MKAGKTARDCYNVHGLFFLIFSELFENYWKKFEEEKVDKYVDNPLFGSGLKFKDTVCDQL